jgi:hypothetical protein
MKKIFVLTVICFLTACSKHANDITIDNPTANVIVYNPTAGAVYHNGDSITISALAIAPAVIHGYDIAIKKGKDTTTCFFEHVHDHNDTIVINKKWKNDLSGSLKLEVELTFYLDHDGHTAVIRVPFSVE